MLIAYVAFEIEGQILIEPVGIEMQLETCARITLQSILIEPVGIEIALLKN